MRASSAPGARQNRASGRGRVLGRRKARRIGLRSGAVGLLVVIVTACGNGGLSPLEPVALSGPLTFVGVNVVDIGEAKVLESQTVVISGDRIVAVGPAGELELPRDAHVVQGNGRYLVPGLVDMHVHMQDADATAYIRHGVTSVRNMWGHPGVRSVMGRIDRGEILGPAIYSTSPGLDGTPPSWASTRIVLDPEDAEAAVAEQIEAGWRSIKIYSRLTPEVYEAVVEASRAMGISFEGHVPHAVGLEAALAAGQQSIEHLGGIDVLVTSVGGRGAGAWRDVDAGQLQEVAAAIALTDTWVCPTLGVYRVFMQRFSPEEQVAIVANQRSALGELNRAGARLLLGTDSGIGLTNPGRSIHEELAEWVDAGLDPPRVLRAATVDAARFMGLEDELGRVVPGLRADLLLVDENPFDRIGSLRHPRGVVLRGAWIPLVPSP